MAIKNKMDLTVDIAVGSGIQIALFVAPALVFASMPLGYPPPLNLHFTPLEIMARGLRCGRAGVLPPLRGWPLKRLAFRGLGDVFSHDERRYSAHMTLWTTVK
jgi:hypothetical protein